LARWRAAAGSHRCCRGAAVAFAQCRQARRHAPSAIYGGGAGYGAGNAPHARTEVMPACIPAFGRASPKTQSLGPGTRMPNRYDGVLRGSPPAFGMVHVCRGCQRRFVLPDFPPDQPDRGEDQLGGEPTVRKTTQAGDRDHRLQFDVPVKPPPPVGKGFCAPQLSLALAGHSPGYKHPRPGQRQNSQTIRSDVQSAGRDEPPPCRLDDPTRVCSGPLPVRPVARTSALTCLVLRGELFPSTANAEFKQHELGVLEPAIA
jgi:hypothetical protein